MVVFYGKYTKRIQKIDKEKKIRTMEYLEKERPRKETKRTLI